jgi:Integrase zinc binding domain
LGKSAQVKVINYVLKNSNRTSFLLGHLIGCRRHNIMSSTMPFCYKELRTEQAVDPVCKKLLLSAEKSLLYELNEVGILVRNSPFDGSQQVGALSPAAGHPGAHRMFQTIRKTFFWPRIAEDIYETVRQCDLCPRNRISEEMKTNPLKLFPANGPLESVSVHILGSLPRTKHGNRFLLVISDRYSKVTKTVPLRIVTALSVARAFCDHWAYV